MKAVLGINVNPGHDTGAAIVVERDGRLQVFAVSTERLDRVKHSRAFPQQAIDRCLQQAGCRLRDIDLIVAPYLLTASAADGAGVYQDPDLARKQAFFRMAEEFGVPVLFADHPLCHAASAYFATDWEDAVTLVIDGHGTSYETQSLFACQGRQLTRLTASNQPGLGWMYSATTEVLLGFDRLQEGKTMGLAGWTDYGGVHSTHFEQGDGVAGAMDTLFPQFVRMGTDGRWELDAPVDLPRRQRNDDPTAPPFVQYAFAAQSELERGVMKLVGYARQIHPGTRRLCLAGGVALNIPANRLIVDSGLFDEVFIQPAATDAGLPLGAALLGYYSCLGGSIRWRMDHAFLAGEYRQPELNAAVGRWSGARSPYAADDLARILDNDYLVAWFQGASEFGPRALGHRSILCCPRDPNMKAYLNREVKHREMFRPFAPIIPFERQTEFFDLAIASPYRLMNSAVLPEHAGLMPAVVHADGTAPVQSVEQRVNPELHELLTAVGACNGIPVLLNTSLNLAGEPIVETPADALDLFARSPLDVLVINGHILSKRPLIELMNTRNPGLRDFASQAQSSSPGAVPSLPAAPAPSGTRPRRPDFVTVGNTAAVSRPVALPKADSEVDAFTRLEIAIDATPESGVVDAIAVKAFHDWCRVNVRAADIPVDPAKVIGETPSRPLTKTLALMELLVALERAELALEVGRMLQRSHPADQRVLDGLRRAQSHGEVSLRPVASAGGPAIDPPHAPGGSGDAMTRVLARLIERIAAAPVDPTPSENYYAEDVFPDDVYQEILDRLPPDECYDFIEHPDAMLADGTRTRKLLDVASHTLTRLPTRDRHFWQAMFDVMSSGALQQAILEKFADRIAARFGDSLPPLVSVPILYRDFPGYRIGVHTDAPYKVATMQFYFPRDMSQAHLGTSFYRRAARGFELYKTNVFKPNSAYGFVRTEESWHGVEQIAMGEARRDTLALTIYVKGKEYRSDGGMM